MKRFGLHKIFGLFVFGLLFFAGFTPVSAKADIDIGDILDLKDLLGAEVSDELAAELEDILGLNDVLNRTPDSFVEEEEPTFGNLLEEKLTETGMSLSGTRKVYDLFGKFSQSDLQELEQWIGEKEQEGEISIRVFVADMKVNEEKSFLEDCADMLCDNGYAKEDLVLLLLNLDYNNRGVCIQGYGLCEERINDDRIEYILDDVIACFSEDDYVYGMKLFAAEAAHYAKSTEYSVYYKDNSFEGKMKRMPWPLIIFAPLAVAFGGVALMKRSNGVTKAVASKTYFQSDSAGLTANLDDYVRTDVSRTYSPVSSGSSGSRSGGRSSGGGGRSSGGRSHSGGSRRF